MTKVSIQPLGERVVAKTIEAETKTASGLYLPDSAKEKPKTAEVLASGKDVKEIKVGDKIIYKDYSTTEVKVDGDKFIILKEEDVLGIIK